jgi:hypothetical protein
MMRQTSVYRITKIRRVSSIHVDITMHTFIKFRQLSNMKNILLSVIGNFSLVSNVNGQLSVGFMRMTER